MKSWQAWKNRLFIALLLGAASAQASADTVVSVSASPDPAVTGSTVDVSVNIADVSDLYAYQFTLSYDPTILRATSVTEGAFLGTGGNTYADSGTIDNTAGSISLIYNSLVGNVSGVNGGGTLAHIYFDVIGYGSSAVGFSDALFLDSNFKDLTVRIDALPIHAVPEPEAYLMLGVGLVGLAALRRRQLPVA